MTDEDKRLVRACAKKMGLTLQERGEGLWCKELWGFYNPLEDDAQMAAIIKAFDMSVERRNAVDHDSKPYQFWAVTGNDKVGYASSESLNRAVVTATASEPNNIFFGEVSSPTLSGHIIFTQP